MIKLTEAFPAVTVPSFLNRVGSLARPSIVVWGRGCSSTVTSTSCFLTLIVTGASSALKCPSSLAVTDNAFSHVNNLTVLQLLQCTSQISHLSSITVVNEGQNHQLPCDLF